MASPLFNSTQSYVLSHAQRFLFQTKKRAKAKKREKYWAGGYCVTERGEPQSLKAEQDESNVIVS